MVAQRKPSRRWWAPIALCVVGVSIAAAAAPTVSDWLMAGFDLHNTRHQPNETILGPDTVGGLKIKWVARLGGSVSATPAVDATSVYVPDWRTWWLSPHGGKLYRIDRGTGRIIWARRVSDYTGIAGDFSRTTPIVSGDRLILGNQAGRLLWPGVPGTVAQVVSVDKATGNLVWATKVDDNPASIVTSSPVAHDGIVYVGVSSQEERHAAFIPGYVCCTFRGSVVALDEATGAILWKTYTVPTDADGEPLPGYSGNAVWGSSPVVDVERNRLYVGTGNNYRLPKPVSDCIAGAGDDEDQIRACDPAVGIDDDGDNYFDSVLALDLDDGSIKWGRRFRPYDEWVASCLLPVLLNPNNCSKRPGVDHDFAQGPALLDGILGIGQKSGDYWGLDPETGAVVWHAKVGPGGLYGGMEWGSATDGDRIYVGVANFPTLAPWTLLDGRTVWTGFWAALDAPTGEVLWQTPSLLIGGAQGGITVANGVIYAGSHGPTVFAPHRWLFRGPTMLALDAVTGEVLWDFETVGSVIGAPAVVDGVVYWGAGFESLGLVLGEQPDNKLYAFGLADD